MKNYMLFCCSSFIFLFSTDCTFILHCTRVDVTVINKDYVDWYYVDW